LQAPPFESPAQCTQAHCFSAPNKKASCGGFFINLAERRGFEPRIGYEPIHAFQACDFNHSSISPESFFAVLRFSEAADYSKSLAMDGNFPPDNE
jgi:hypothetical protein